MNKQISIINYFVIMLSLSYHYMKGERMQQKDEQQEDIVNANFKVDRQLWNAFKIIAKKNNCDASKVLRSFIIQYIQNNENLSKI